MKMNRNLKILILIIILIISYNLGYFFMSRHLKEKILNF